jgi:hypothetical protein
MAKGLFLFNRGPSESINGLHEVFSVKGKQIEVEPRIKRPLALGRRAFFYWNDVH